MVKKFDVYLCETHGVEKPCVILSSDDMCQVLPYLLIAPITSAERNFPCRLGVKLKGQQGQIALDLIHTVPKTDLGVKLGSLPERMQTETIEILKNLLIQ